MSENTHQEAPSEQSDKPVPREVLDKLRQMDQARSRFGQQLLDLESERIFLLANVRRLDDERSKLFSALLVERGYSPDTPAQIDPETGLLTPIKQSP